MTSFLTKTKKLSRYVFEKKDGVVEVNIFIKSAIVMIIGIVILSSVAENITLSFAITCELKLITDSNTVYLQTFSISVTNMIGSIVFYFPPSAIKKRKQKKTAKRMLYQKKSTLWKRK